MAENANGVYVKQEEEEVKLKQRKGREKKTLPEVFNHVTSAILFPEAVDAGSILRRIKVSVADNAPLLPEASRNSANDVLFWTRRGSPFRALFVISVGSIIFVALTGLLVFLLFLLAATINAIVISLLISLATAGGFLALFFALAGAIYVAAFIVVIFAISVSRFLAIVAILITTGWIGFFYTVWLVTRKIFGFATHLLGATGSAISSYTTAWHARHPIHKDSN